MKFIGTGEIMKLIWQYISNMKVYLDDSLNEPGKSERDIRGEEIINEILDCIDFDQIHYTMKTLNWKWWDVGVPSEETIRKETKERLWRAWNEKQSNFSGGIYIKYLPEEDCEENGWSNEGLMFYFVLECGGAFHNEFGELEYIP